ncbi:MAG TPA: DUF4339 domain-containing protein, partial [Verrucomicrobiae bacterium]|nr:DUF4339 domain-containing protein [Verrucomicrobiae bacterium]
MANYIIIGGDGKEYGPVTDADVRQWIAEGRLSAESRVKAESDAEFRALAQFPEFAEALKPAAAPGIITPPGGGTGAEDFNWEANVLAREPELRFAECLAAGWGFLGANAGFMGAAVFLAWVANLVLVVISVTVPLIGPFVWLCFKGVIMGGLYLTCLRRLRGEAVSPADVFCGFKVAFPQLLLAGLVSALLSELGFCCLVLPGLYLFIGWFFAVPLVADKKMFFWAAMELSRKVITRVWFEVFVLLIIAYLPWLLFNVYNGVETGKYFMGLWDQSGHNWQQLATAMQSQAGDLRNLTIRSTLIGQGI